MGEQLVFKDRRGTDCCKWDGLEETFGEKELLAMWVADMDIQAPECVRESLKEYIEQGIFGYYQTPDSYFQAFIDWERDRHGYEVKQEWIRFAPGVVPAVHWMVQALTDEGDSILIQTPVYYPFERAIRTNNRRPVSSELVENNGVYSIDFADFERKIADEKVKLFILCSPHNPAGRVWTRDELERMLNICRQYGVKVIADEIHQDIIIGDRRQIPAATVGDYASMLVTMTAATKTFNLAGCSNSFVIIQDEEIRESFDRMTDGIWAKNGNAFGYVAVKSAYEGGGEWLQEVLKLIRQNYEYLKNTLEEKLPEAVVTPLEGTYLAWVNLGAYIPEEQMEKVIQGKCRLAVDYGDWFGGEKSKSFIRLNLATSPENVKETVRILTEVLSF